MHNDQLLYLKKKSVLIAETDVNLAAQINVHLSKMNYVVYPAISSGEELIAQAILLEPSLIITNTNLNGQLDGIEAISRLEEMTDINYIFITAYDDYNRLISSYYLHPLEIIKKPIDFNNLCEYISGISLEKV